MTKVRPAGSFFSLGESMNNVSEVRDFAELVTYLQGLYDFWQPTEDNVQVKPYGFDDRIGWDTWLVTIDGKAAVFADGNLPHD